MLLVVLFTLIEEVKMSTGKSLLFAAGITVASVLALFLVKGAPTPPQVTVCGPAMFLMAFIVMKSWGGDKG